MFSKFKVIFNIFLLILIGSTNIKAEEDTTLQRALIDGVSNNIQTLSAKIIAKRAQRSAQTSVKSNWYKNFDFAGLLEVEAYRQSPYQGKWTSDLDLAAAEILFANQLNSWIDTGVSFLYEEGSTDLEVDTGYITLADPHATPFFLNLGQIYLPFGNYMTNSISDPLTISLGNIRESALQIGFARHDFYGSMYLFQGDNKIQGETKLSDWGANLGYSHEEENQAWAVSIGYLNNLGDSNTLREIINQNQVAAFKLGLQDTQDPTDRVGGMSARAAVTLGSFNLLGGYVAATDEFDPVSLPFKSQGAKPAAWNLEADWNFKIMDHSSVIILSYQGTREALALELPRQRWLVGWSLALAEQLALTLEWAHDIDYNNRDGGTGESGNTLTAQLAVTF